MKFLNFDEFNQLRKTIKRLGPANVLKYKTKMKLAKRYKMNIAELSYSHIYQVFPELHQDKYSSNDPMFADSNFSRSGCTSLSPSLRE